MYSIPDHEKGLGGNFQLVLRVPYWVSADMHRIILETAQGVLLGYAGLPEGTKQLITLVTIGRGSWEHNKEIGDLVIEVELAHSNSGEGLKLNPPLRNDDHSKGLSRRIQGCFQAHVIAGVLEWSTRTRMHAKELMDRTKKR